MKIAILSRYQTTIARGAESFVTELSKQLSNFHQVDILEGKDSDDIEKIIKGHYDLVIPMNGRIQALKVRLGRYFGHYKIISIGQSGIGKDLWWNLIGGDPDAFVALTDEMYDWAKQKSPKTKVVKIGNGVDLSIFKPQGTKYKTKLSHPLVISVGALEWYKGHRKTIDALSLLPDVNLLIVGQGSEKDELIKLAGEKISGRFEITSAAYKNLPEMYRAADLFVLPSWSREAFGIVYIEAMATNLPAIGPNDKTRREIIGQGGLVAYVDNPKLFAETIEKALKQKWGDAPRQQAERFSWNNIGKKYLDLIEELS